MARMRSIKPEFFADQDLAEELPIRDARLLYIGLWGLADEHGRLRGDARAIKGQLFAFDDDLDAEAVDKLLDMIAESGRAIRYRVGKATYLFLPKLANHQRLEADKVPSRLPGPDDEQAERSMIASSENFPDESAPVANESTPDGDEFALARARSFKHVAGSSEHVAGSSEQTLPLGVLTELEPKILTKRAIAEAFTRFWAVYPKRVARGDAEKAFEKAAKEKNADLELIIAGAERYRDDGARMRADIKYTKHPASWISAKCWLDETPPPQQEGHSSANGHRSYRNPEDTSIYEGAL